MAPKDGKGLRALEAESEAAVVVFAAVEPTHARERRDVTGRYG